MGTLAAALLASILALAAASPAGAQNLHEPKRIPGVGELFVLRAGGGELERVRAGVFELVLRRPSSVVTAFSDRPARLTREQRLRSFVSSWSSFGFRADPPNAALSIAGAPSARDVLVLEISRPRLGAGGRTLRFRARPLAGEPKGRLRRFAQRADRAGTRRFGPASLFVDPSEQEVVADFHFGGLPQGSLAVVDLSNALVDMSADATVPINVHTTGPADALVSLNTLLAAPTAAATVDVDIALSMSVQAGATRLEGDLALPTGATASVTIGPGTVVPLSNGDFSVPLQ
jgi:hypothetical protein